MRTSKANKGKILAMLIITFILGIVFLFVGFRGKKTEKYYYAENNIIDYKVYLKENNYFDSPYLEKNKTYITSLIDYIDTRFNYNVEFNKPVTGSIDYQLIAQISADRENNEVGNYWTKEYVLTDKKTEQIKNRTSCCITVDQKIDYSNYNNILESFISEYELSSESTLKIYLKVTGNVKVDNTSESMDINSNISLDMPLSKLAIDGTVHTDNKNNQKEIDVTNKRCELICLIYKILFCLDIILFCVYVYKYIECIRINKKYASYRTRIKKINNDYEGIITNVKSANISNFTIIQVEEFDDLLNVYNNVREPINCKVGLDKTLYFIINNTSCFVYTINKEDYEK